MNYKNKVQALKVLGIVWLYLVFYKIFYSDIFKIDNGFDGNRINPHDLMNLQIKWRLSANLDYEALIKEREKRFKKSYFSFQKLKSFKRLLCDLKEKGHPKLFLYKDESVRNESLSKFLPKESLFNNRMFNSCAIVSNSGAMLGSKLGSFIDSHDLVMRFNYAPTEGYEEDVGSKTTIRCSNSQPLRFVSSHPLSQETYSDSAVLFWQTGKNSTSSLDQVLSQNDLLENLINQIKRNNSQPLHLMKPDSVWSLHEFIQSEFDNEIPSAPPTTGFIGFYFVLQMCKVVRLFEFIPSIRETSKCHYFSNYTTDVCITWHPNRAEKMLLYYMNKADDRETYIKGYTTVQGFSDLKC